MSFVCPRELGSFARPTELVNFDLQHVTHFPLIGGITKVN